VPEGIESRDPVPIPMGVVESPGGSPVCSLAASTCQSMNNGVALSPAQAVEVVVAAKPDVGRFVASRLFDGFGAPWDSFLSALRQDDVSTTLISCGEATATYQVVDRLRGRLNFELVTSLAQSNLYKRTFLQIFKMRPDPASVFKALERGRFDGIAQSAGFFNRVKHLKNLIDCVLIEAERRSQYLPSYISASQRMRYLGTHARAREHLLADSIHAGGYGLRSDVTHVRPGTRDALVARFNRLPSEAGRPSSNGGEYARRAY